MNAVLGWLWVALCGLFYGLYLSTFSWKTASVTSLDGWQDHVLCGVWDIKPYQTGGLKSREEILQEVSAQGLDFVVLTYLENDHLPPMGYYHRTLVIHAFESRYLDDKYLWVLPDGVPSSFVDRLVEPDGRDIIIWLNPWDENGYLRRDKPIPAGVRGISLFSLKDWGHYVFRRRLLSVFWSLGVYPFNAELSLLRLYDVWPNWPDQWIQLLNSPQLSRSSSFSGIVTLDYNAKAILHPGLVLEFPPLKWALQTWQHCLVLDRPVEQVFERDWPEWLKAMQKGYQYWGLATLGSLKSFIWDVRLKGKNQWEWRFQLKAKPVGAWEVRLWKDAQVLYSSRQPEDRWVVLEPGRYWMSVHVRLSLPFPDMPRWVLWLATNPIGLSP